MRLCYVTLALVFSVLALIISERRDVDASKPPEIVRALTEEDDDV